MPHGSARLFGARRRHLVLPHAAAAWASTEVGTTNPRGRLGRRRLSRLVVSAGVTRIAGRPARPRAGPLLGAGAFISSRLGRTVPHTPLCGLPATAWATVRTPAGAPVAWGGQPCRSTSGARGGETDAAPHGLRRACGASRACSAAGAGGGGGGGGLPLVASGPGCHLSGSLPNCSQRPQCLLRARGGEAPGVRGGGGGCRTRVRGPHAACRAATRPGSSRQRPACSWVWRCSVSSFRNLNVPCPSPDAGAPAR